MQTFYLVFSAILCLFCFLCCKGWATAMDIVAGKDKRMIRMARTFDMAGDVFSLACWLFIVAGFLRTIGLF